MLANEPSGNVPELDLKDEIRPALIRIGDRIAWLLVQLPDDLDRDRTRAETKEWLGGLGLSQSTLEGIADSIVGIASKEGAPAAGSTP